MTVGGTNLGKLLAVLAVIWVCPPVAAEQVPGDALDAEPGQADAEPWLVYRWEVSRGFVLVEVSIDADRTARVVVDEHNDNPVIRYTTELTRAEADWYRTLLERTDYANPQRREFELVGGDGGMIEVIGLVSGQRRAARFGDDPAFTPLIRAAWRLVAQALMHEELDRAVGPAEGSLHEVHHGLRSRRPLQPCSFVEPLTRAVLRSPMHVHEGLPALALVTTPEHWGGVLVRVLEEAERGPAISPTLSRRDVVLWAIGAHGFAGSVGPTHWPVLRRVYLEQLAALSAEAEAGGSDASIAMRLIRHSMKLTDALPGFGDGPLE